MASYSLGPTANKLGSQNLNPKSLLFGEVHKELSGKSLSFQAEILLHVCVISGVPCFVFIFMANYNDGIFRNGKNILSPQIRNT